MGMPDRHLVYPIFNAQKPQAATTGVRKVKFNAVNISRKNISATIFLRMQTEQPDITRYIPTIISRTNCGDRG
jgi:hypothetical protein